MSGKNIKVCFESQPSCALEVSIRNGRTQIVGIDVIMENVQGAWIWK